MKFLEVVDHLQPRYWALENVPRVAEVLRKGFEDPKHVLHRFRHLAPQIEVIDFSDYGAPQSRRRCIAGNIPFELIEAYRPRLPSRTLGDVIAAVTSEGEVVDPVWGARLARGVLTETEVEETLNAEELRMNREAKTFHPIYNNMAFPDRARCASPDGHGNLHPGFAREHRHRRSRASGALSQIDDPRACVPAGLPDHLPVLRPFVC